MSDGYAFDDLDPISKVGRRPYSGSDVKALVTPTESKQEPRFERPGSGEI